MRHTHRRHSQQQRSSEINHSKTLIQLNKIYFNLNRFECGCCCCYCLGRLLLLLLRQTFIHRMPCRHVLVFTWNLIYIFSFFLVSFLCEMTKERKKKQIIAEWIHFFIASASFLRNTKFIHECECVVIQARIRFDCNMLNTKIKMQLHSMHYIIKYGFSVSNSAFATHHMEAHIQRTPHEICAKTKCIVYFRFAISWEENHDAVAADGGWWWCV